MGAILPGKSEPAGAAFFGCSPCQRVGPAKMAVWLSECSRVSAGEAVVSAAAGPVCVRVSRSKRPDGYAARLARGMVRHFVVNHELVSVSTERPFGG